jgi:hypothetical protein
VVIFLWCIVYRLPGQLDTRREPLPGDQDTLGLPAIVEVEAFATLRPCPPKVAVRGLPEVVAPPVSANRVVRTQVADRPTTVGLLQPPELSVEVSSHADTLGF